MIDRTYRARHALSLVVLCILWAVLWVKIGVIQCVRHEALLDEALNQHVSTVSLDARRGRMLDRNGEQLAMSIPSASYGIRPSEIDNPGRAASLLSRASAVGPGRVRSLLGSDKPFVWLLRQADDTSMERLDELDLPGIHKLPSWRRCYPLGSTGAQVIGYTDVDGRGIEGCELAVNNRLAGRDGRSHVLRDARGRTYQSLDDPLVDPRQGADVMLSLDWRIQEIADEEIARAVDKWHARWGGIIVLDPATGDILAMANAPSFDPNDPRSFDEDYTDPNVRRNRLVTDMYEPGSTFKIVTFAEALESGVVDETTLIDCMNGKYRIAGHTINDTHEMGTVPAADVLVHSSNIGTVKIAERIGKKQLNERARLMGYGEVLGIDFPNESPGDLPDPRNWSGLSLPTISFGQGIAATPLQIAMSYAAVANGGVLMKPRLVKEVRDENGTRVAFHPPKKIRQAMTKETARRIENLLCDVVTTGTGQSAAVVNLTVAGKTGTAQRISENKRGYEPGKYVSSFVGYLANREPSLLCLVIIDSPVGVYYGSQVAAPVFKNVMARVVNMGGTRGIDVLAEHRVEEENGDAETDERGDRKAGLAAVLPALKGLDVRSAVEKIEQLGFRVSLVGDSTTVSKQFPVAGTSLKRGSDVTLYSDVYIADTSAGIRVPDVRGKSLRAAVYECVELGLEVKIEGSGRVVRQEPEAGALVSPESVCVLTCNQ